MSKGEARHVSGNRPTVRMKRIIVMVANSVDSSLSALKTHDSEADERYLYLDNERLDLIHLS